MTSGPISNLVMGSVGVASKLFLRLFVRDLRIHNLPVLVAAIEGRPPGTPLITVSNHTSTLDDPLLFGILPPRILFSAHKMRWALGAEELLFTNPIFSAFFSTGRVLGIRRGDGVMQPNVTSAIQHLNRGDWVHVFPEGRCVPDSTRLKDRLKWGVGRMLLEAQTPPILLPIIHQGLEHVKPLGVWLPRPTKSLCITVGQPVDTAALRKDLSTISDPNEQRSRATAFVASEMSKCYQDDWRRP